MIMSYCEVIELAGEAWKNEADQYLEFDGSKKNNRRKMLFL